MISSPCKDCMKRELGCHSICEAYKEFAQMKDNERKKSLESRTTRHALYEIKCRRIRK